MSGIIIDKCKCLLTSVLCQCPLAKDHREHIVHISHGIEDGMFPWGPLDIAVRGCGRSGPVLVIWGRV